jgi:hypothetical protein
LEAEGWVRDIQDIRDSLGLRGRAQTDSPPPQEPQKDASSDTPPRSPEPDRPAADDKGAPPKPRAPEYMDEERRERRGKPEASRGGGGPANLHGTDISFEYPNGDVYVGDWVRGKKHGRGKYTRKDGTIYLGDYENDHKHGQGKCTWSNGNVYVGKWADGLQSGRGTLTCPDGRKYVGSWKEGKQHGQVRC